MKKILKDKRFIVIVIAIVLVFILMNFNQRMVLMTRLRQQEKVLVQEYADLETTREVLQTQIAYADSDEAVEKWAREEGGMIQEGDIPIVLLPQSAPAATPTKGPEVVIVKVSRWEIWQELFFGD